MTMPHFALILEITPLNTIHTLPKFWDHNKENLENPFGIQIT